MQQLVYICIGVVALYAAYRILGVWILPRIAQRKLERYKKDFFAQNPQVDPDAYKAREQEAEDKTLIIEKRRNYK